MYGKGGKLNKPDQKVSFQNILAEHRFLILLFFYLFIFFLFFYINVLYYIIIYLKFYAMFTNISHQYITWYWFFFF